MGRWVVDPESELRRRRFQKYCAALEEQRANAALRQAVRDLELADKRLEEAKAHEAQVNAASGARKDELPPRDAKPTPPAGEPEETVDAEPPYNRFSMLELD